MMGKFLPFRISILLLLLAGFSIKPANAGNPPAYEQRREAFIQTALANYNGDAITLQAYKGLPVDLNEVNLQLDQIQTSPEADFRLVKLVRVLNFSNGQYDDVILPRIQHIKFWLAVQDTQRQYWSENHMIMWMSSNWLLHEKYNFPIDATLRTRIVHYLNLKIQYGYYEFFSSVYSPYTLSGLLNLADFAQDAEIRNLATQAAQRLLKNFLMMANDKGVMFPAAGRNYNSKYERPYTQNHTKIIYLLTGFGQTPDEGSHASNFLATSTIPLTDVIESWTPELNIEYTFGHSLQDGINNINNGLNRFDRTVFQWSSGAYFHPDVAQDSYWLIDSIKLYDFEEFNSFSFLFVLPFDLTNLAEPVAKLLASASRSSVICGQTVDIFKNKSVVLTSIQDFWKGRMGWQQWPWAANTGTGAVFTQAGNVRDFATRADDLNNNSHLPYIDQKDNVALIMYRHNRDLDFIVPLLGPNTFDVGLHWPDAVFDEQREVGNWILGREDEGYVAVYRHCIDSINGVPACDNPDGQTWVAIVGNQDMYGSFDQFEDVIRQSRLETRWYFDIATLQWVYYSRIEIDGKMIEYAWGGNILSGPTQPTGIFNHSNKVFALNLYPNPVSEELRVDLSAFRGQEAGIRIHNLLGQEMYSETGNTISGETKRISTAGWSSGTYVISVESETQKGCGQFIVQH